MDEGGGAFYGPKISVQARDAIGRTWQMSTIQLDFQLPQRFDLHYVGTDNERHRPIMIHRPSSGRSTVLRHPHRALRRCVPGLARRCRSRCCRWPWHGSTASVVDELRRWGSVETTDAHSDNLGTRIRRAKLDKVPYILVVGDDDVANGTVGVNRRGSEHPERDVPAADFLARVRGEIDTRVTA
jgi:threonyl-tRNA synthetase